MSQVKQCVNKMVAMKRKIEPKEQVKVEEWKMPLYKTKKVIVPLEKKQPQPDNKKVILNLIKPDNHSLVVGFDRRSQMGQFAWETINTVHVPYVFRWDTQRFIPLRIVNQNVLPCYFNIFKQDFFDMFTQRSFTITEPERKVFNEINVQHCNCAYGLNPFQKGEQLLILDDVIQLEAFMHFVFDRMILRQKITNPKFGYMMFNTNQHIVPFYKIDGKHCFPIHYFEGDEQILCGKSIQLNGFAENCLRFLVRLQNVDMLGKPMKVITLDEIRKFFQKDTKFEESWIAMEHDEFVKNSSKTGDSSILRVVNNDANEARKFTDSLMLPYCKLLYGNEGVALLCTSPNENNQNVAQVLTQKL